MPNISDFLSKKQILEDKHLYLEMLKLEIQMDHLYGNYPAVLGREKRLKRIKSMNAKTFSKYITLVEKW